jgi:hypothetical protein
VRQDGNREKPTKAAYYTEYKIICGTPIMAATMRCVRLSIHSAFLPDSFLNISALTGNFGVFQQVRRISK